MYDEIYALLRTKLTELTATADLTDEEFWNTTGDVFTEALAAKSKAARAGHPELAARFDAARANKEV
jgi:hypothetical protein